MTDIGFKLTRRAFCGASLAMAAPGAFSAETAPKWSTGAFAAVDATLRAVTRHEFVKGLAGGSLAKEKFAFYHAQNVHYLDGYAKSLDALARRLDSAADVAMVLGWRDETVQSCQWSRDLWNEFSGKKPLPAPVPAAEFYRSFEAATVARGTVLQAWAALLPCFWVYDKVGVHVKNTRVMKGNPYAPWIEYYGDPEYSKTVAKAVDLADRLAAAGTQKDREEAVKAFHTSVRLEWLLFDAAWNMKDWDV